jgi:hypothetical protein
MKNIFEQVDYPEHESIVNRMKEEIVDQLGSAAWESITSGIELPKADMNSEQMSKATYNFIKRLDQIAGVKSANSVFSRVCHGLKRKDFYWARTKFLQYNDIDAFAEAVREEQMKDLRSYLNSEKSFYGQMIDDEVYTYADSMDHLFYGKRYGNQIKATAIPFNIRKFLDEKDPVKKRFYLCHCYFVNQSILGNETVSKTMCYCSLGHTKIFWEAALDTELKGDVVGSALNGDMACEFVIYLSEEIIQKYTHE